MKDLVSENKKFCECGCSQEIELKNCRGQPKHFAKGHNVVNFVKHGPEHPSWKGGRRYDKDGYVMVWHPNHPRNIYGNYVHEHILILEKYLGRYLADGELAHHINEIKDDNRIENLQLMTDKQHKQYHTLKMWKEGKYNNRRIIPIRDSNGNFRGCRKAHSYQELE